MHWLILFLLLWTMVTYFKFPQLLVSFQHVIDPATSWITSFIPYVRWLVDASLTPDVTYAFVSTIYLCFMLLFANLFLIVFPAFNGIPKQRYVLSNIGFADFLEEHVYSRLSPSISLITVNQRIARYAAHGQQLIEKDGFKQIIAAYFQGGMLPHYGVLVVASFAFFPWVAYDKVNSTSLTSLPFWLAVVIFAYSQARLVFEAIVLLLPFFMKNKTEGV